jgi:hypothetical protein
MHRVPLKAILCALCCVSSVSAHGEAQPARMLTAYSGGGCNGAKRLPEFELFLGAKAGLAVDNLDQRSWDTLRGSAAWGSKCWKAAGRKLALGLPMLPKGDSTSLAEGAQGKYDDVFEDIAKTLIATGNADAIIRIGWEFNGGWFPWAAAKDPNNYVVFWRRIVSIFRKVPGANFRFDWCAGHGANQFPPDKVYPGDDVVDIIGLDVYDQIWNKSAENAEARWIQYEYSPFGLRWQRDFARAHGKLMSYPEWGTGDRPDGHGGGDNGYFVRKMAEWIKSNPVEYHGYWDYKAGDYDAMISDGRRPNAASAFKRAFGGSQ